jgi:hypothetical protein
MTDNNRALKPHSTAPANDITIVSGTGIITANVKQAMNTLAVPLLP